MPRGVGKASKATLARIHRGMNRNLLILGSITLLTMGGVAVFLASRKGGDTFNTKQNITNEIIHNNYFTQLIASGVTTEKDLDAVTDIRPYGDGFIGMSKESMVWERAQALAKRTGSGIMSVEHWEGGSRQQSLEWLSSVDKTKLSPTLWIQEQGEARVLADSEVVKENRMGRERNTILHWQKSMSGASVLASATKDEPFVNSIGLKFVPVPDTKVLLCIHEVRRQDYAAYASEVTDVEGSWKAPERDGIPCGHENDHPVVNISWDDAQKFCQWLSKKEGLHYRLPTDREWSYAVGIGPAEKWTKDTKAANLHGIIQDAFPWGNRYPPKSEDQAGNYADTTWKEKFPNDPSVENYTDGFSTTAPVMSFKPNELGIYDLGGNVWEWCEDSYNAKQRELRGGSWYDSDRSYLLSSWRFGWTQDTRTTVFGFRVALETTPSKVTKASAQGPNYETVTELIKKLGGRYEEDGPSVGNLEQIVRVSLSGKSVDDKMLLQLRGLAGLTSLNLNGCDNVGDLGVSVVKSMGRLESLDLGHCFRMTDHGFEDFANLSNLTSLKLQESGSYTYTGAGLVHLRALKNLRILDLGYSLKLEDSNLVNLTNLSNLNNLNLIRCEKLTDASAEYLGQMSALEKLNLAGTQITDVGLQKLENLKRLKEIILGGNAPDLGTQVSDAGVSRFQRALPNVKILR